MVLAHQRGISQLPSSKIWQLDSHTFGFWHMRNMTHPKIPRVCHFSATWWPILKKKWLRMGTHGAHKYTKFREDQIIYAKLRPNKPRRWAPFCCRPASRPPHIYVLKRGTPPVAEKFNVTLEMSHKHSNGNKALQIGQYVPFSSIIVFPKPFLYSFMH